MGGRLCLSETPPSEVTGLFSERSTSVGARGPEPAVCRGALLRVGAVRDRLPTQGRWRRGGGAEMLVSHQQLKHPQADAGVPNKRGRGHRR